MNPCKQIKDLTEDDFVCQTCLLRRARYVYFWEETGEVNTMICKPCLDSFENAFGGKGIVH